MKDETNFPHQANTFMTTEHFTLQSARAIVNGEISNKVSVYFTTLSSIIVATAFIAQIPNLSDIFLLIGIVAFPMVIILGFFTTTRIGVLSSMDAAYIKAINKVRNFYFQSTPEIEEFLFFPPFDDETSNSIYGGWQPNSFSDNLLSSANIVVTCNSLLLMTFVSMFLIDFNDFSVFSSIPLMILLLIGSYLLHAIFAVTFLKNSNLSKKYKDE